MKNSEIITILNNEETIEMLADIEHERISKWKNHIFNVCKKGKDNSLIIPNEYVKQWDMQRNTYYENLKEKEKHEDRNDAKKILNLLSIIFKRKKKT